RHTRFSRDWSSDVCSSDLDRLLVAELGPGGVEVGDVRALVVGGDLERRAGPGRGLLEDQGDLLARQTLGLDARVLGHLQRLGEVEQEPQLGRREVDLLEEAAVAQVLHRGHLRGGGPVGQYAGSRSSGQLRQWAPPRPRLSSLPGMVMTSMPTLRSLVFVYVLRS